ncbi:MAG TPA: hypothetical protein VHY58_07105, partial [Streptosporangiaceae bacterium]|nr:hypothetical protein [Streptosporangiaceae bacterium]
YPAAYRTANGEEMLGVAMASAKPGQRWPGVGRDDQPGAVRAPEASGWPAAGCAQPGVPADSTVFVVHLLYVAIMVLAFILLTVTSRLEPTVRRRVFALSIAPVVAAALSGVVFGGGIFIYGTRPFGLPSLTWPEWVALLLLPALGLLAALAWIVRRERPRPPATAVPAAVDND